MQRLLDFVHERLGKFVRSPNGLGGQCVDLVELWAINTGAIWIPGNAAELLMNARPKDYSIVRNGAANYPMPGDIVVWGAWEPLEISGFGHTAIALHADAYRLIVASQNWPDGAPVAVTWMTYGGCRGWLQRKAS